MSDTPEDKPQTAEHTSQSHEARVPRRQFMKDTLATVAGVMGASMLAGENEAQAADPRPQRIRAFKMRTVNKSWEDAVNDTLDAILKDPIQYPGRAEIQFVPPPGNNVPARIPGGAPYNIAVAMRMSPTYQALDADTRKKVEELYVTRHSYAIEHAQFKMQMHNALVGGKAPYPILYEQVIGKPLKENGQPDLNARDERLGYVCKPGGNDTADEKLPYFAYDDRSYDMEGELKGPANDRKLVINLTMKLDGLGFSYGHMDGCKVGYVRKNGAAYKLPTDGDDIHALDPNAVKAQIGVAPVKGDRIYLEIPVEILRKQLKQKVGMLGRPGEPEVMYANAQSPADDPQLVANLQQAHQVSGGMPVTHLDRLAGKDIASGPDRSV